MCTLLAMGDFLLHFPHACSKYNRQNSVNLDESKMFSAQSTESLFEGENQAHANMISYTVTHPPTILLQLEGYVASNEIRLTVLFSCRNRRKSFVGLEETRPFIVAEIAFVCEHALRGNTEYSYSEKLCKKQIL
jgi:hypothetical protein